MATIGSITWTERTGGVLTARECVSLARPLVRDELRIATGLLAMLLRRHSGRQRVVDPVDLEPPDSSIARDAEDAARELLTPALLNHSRRAFAWGSAIAALQQVEFDRELLYVASMFHDTGLPSPVPHVDFTVRSAEIARAFLDERGVAAPGQELVADAIALHHTPGVSPAFGGEAFLLSPAPASTSSACAATRSPTASGTASSASSRGSGSKPSSPASGDARHTWSPGAAPGTCTDSP